MDLCISSEIQSCQESASKARAASSVQAALVNEMDCGARKGESKSQSNPVVETPASVRGVVAGLEEYTPEKIGMQTESR